ncbi:MAG: cysteine desulfurase family protein [Planctomycetota bacterium]
MIYLDHNATTPPTPAVREAVASAMDQFWQNPSSVHRPGQAVRHAIELARRDLAALVGVKPRELVFTSGGTESIDTAIRGVLRPAADDRPRLITTAVEHAAVRDLAESLGESAIEVVLLRLDASGRVEPPSVEASLDEARSDGRRALVSVQWANNETGVIQPVHAIGEACRDARVPFHCDATQWVGKMPTDLASTDAPPIDLMTFSPHKFGGPKGIGLLWARRGVRWAPALHGSQELGRRGGTENVPGILGAGAAARDAMEWLEDPSRAEQIAALRDGFERTVLEGVRPMLPEARVNPDGDAERLWNTTNIAFPTLEAEALLIAMSERGVCASAGAACSSGSLDPSPVLLAMGVPPKLAHGSVRFSLGRETTEAELIEASRVVIDVVRAQC